jgi:3-methyl-2-oxobutanoate hydroxymethyltransferase
MLGLLEEFSPKFVKRYGEFGKEITKAVAEYVDDVKKGKFPGSEHSY